jgi:hypothetical protein
LYLCCNRCIFVVILVSLLWSLYMLYTLCLCCDCCTITSHLNLLHTKHTTTYYKQCYWWFRHICTTCPKVSVSALSWFIRNIFFYWSSQFITDITELLLRVTVNTHNAINTTWLSVEKPPVTLFIICRGMFCVQ